MNCDGGKWTAAKWTAAKWTAAIEGKGRGSISKSTIAAVNGVEVKVMVIGMGWQRHSDGTRWIVWIGWIQGFVEGVVYSSFEIECLMSHTKRSLF